MNTIKSTETWRDEWGRPLNRVGSRFALTNRGWCAIDRALGRTADESLAEVVRDGGVMRARLSGSDGPPRTVEFPIAPRNSLGQCCDHWHCDPALAAHKCDKPDRTKPCPSCGEAPSMPDLLTPDERRVVERVRKWRNPKHAGNGDAVQFMLTIIDRLAPPRPRTTDEVHREERQRLLRAAPPRRRVSRPERMGAPGGIAGQRGRAVQARADRTPARRRQGSSMNVTKGTRIRAEWWDTHPVCLAGVQLKVGGTLRSIEGTVRHIRSDHPTTPVHIRVHVEHGSGELCEKCGVREVAIDPAWIVAVVPMPGVES